MPGDEAQDRVVLLGRITRVQGLGGEVRITAYSGDPTAFLELERLGLGESRLAIERARVQKRQAIVKLEGVDRREAAEPLVGSEVWAYRAELPPADEQDAFYWVDLIGCRVVDKQGVELGTVKDLMRTGAHDTLVLVRRGAKEGLIPFVDEMVVEVDLAGRRIEVDLPEGLLE